jgi:hypothetical protein
MTLGDSLDSGEYLEGPNRRRDRDRYRDRRRSRFRARPHSPMGRLIVGALIATWGLSLLLDNLGFGDLREYMHRAWPAALVIVGVTMLIHRDSNPERYGFWGTVSLAAGTWLYLGQRDWFHSALAAVVWPALLISLGAWFVYRGLRPSSHVP